MTGPAESKIFLEANKTKDGVITLPSGLQYKVLKKGLDVYSPEVGSPCECHYEGTLIDGAEFDSSYKRGTPTTFAPNQVIKGWTEAMQLMVEGEKWEMYIKSDMAYGDDGKPPKIPGGAALIFRMEILKIKGDKVLTREYPEWTQEQVDEFFTEKDQAACQKWREAREKTYAEGGLRDKHPTEEGFKAWLDTQCLSTKNKTVIMRMKKAANAPAPAAGKLNAKTARELLTKTIEALKEPANKKKLEDVKTQCDAAPAEQRDMMKMMMGMQTIQAIAGPVIAEFGYGKDDLMKVTGDVKAFEGEDPTIAVDSAKLMKAAQGDLSAIYG